MDSKGLGSRVEVKEEISSAKDVNRQMRKEIYENNRKVIGITTIMNLITSKIVQAISVDKGSMKKNHPKSLLDKQAVVQGSNNQAEESRWQN